MEDIVWKVSCWAVYMLHIGVNIQCAWLYILGRRGFDDEWGANILC